MNFQADTLSETTMNDVTYTTRGLDRKKQKRPYLNDRNVSVKVKTKDKNTSFFKKSKYPWPGILIIEFSEALPCP
jgi:hypothetical protein